MKVKLLKKLRKQASSRIQLMQTGRRPMIDINGNAVTDMVLVCKGKKYEKLFRIGMRPDEIIEEARVLYWQTNMPFIRNKYSDYSKNNKRK